MEFTNHETLLFKSSIIRQNMKRILILGCLYTFFEIIGLIMSSLGFFESNIRFYVAIIVAFHLLYLPTLFWITKKSHEDTAKNIKRMQIIELIYYLIITTWSSIFTVLVYLDDKDIAIYAIVLMLISALFIVTPICRNIIYPYSFILFTSLVYWNSQSILAANEIVFKALIITIIATFISKSNFTTQGELAISQFRLLGINEKLKDETLKDSLTGLYNNSYIFDYLETKITTDSNPGHKLSILMLDIDNFKMINDHFGHIFGDTVIKSIATYLVESTRHNDIAGRYGGEEFVVILDDIDLSEATFIAERICKGLPTLEFEYDIQVTSSIGVAEFSGQTVLELVKEADDNLYQAKAQGKNRVVS